jgi:hypothetical protein
LVQVCLAQGLIFFAFVLLAVFQDRLPVSPGSVLTGRVAAAELGPQAFIPQDVAFFAHLTVAETLTLAAQLRRGRATDLEHHGGTDADKRSQAAAAAWDEQRPHISSWLWGSRLHTQTRRRGTHRK